ncbi:hypothetical protein F442_09963 [Phytophthora nicotianae P10297]|uniref:Late embryogenesis abundant protein LEA-2 subgroup domain-containing protein n=3 Tax=Phytophthora nicotianae TaxID=4792 RepID=W2R7V6_PHYN3|nr:hypothetical protein PPTG_01538 [Phytophthora nicotianae INRA-310]ETL38712.1 hypothetical protein L916_09756 [Phytophthora nicotianae]ETP43235.1 hypothetical protein F442_09963 [Phytophthora nicotianae P10297]KUF67239.1 hypothetical protein AM587_10014795 [Phytophthora nicotianae]ETM45116.1 hypothetical protein L914_09725 [Phytophthora nicotianae]ETN21311.1 hypothetical protein PPTG_01538 [Phytophthora nicotianae INRA-310]
MSTTPNTYADKVHTPVAEGAHYNDETALRLDVSAPGTDNKKGDGDSSVPMDKNGRPLVKFFKWHMTRKQRILLISGLVILLIGVILLIVFLAIIPAIIQHYVNSVELSINYLDVKSIPSDTALNVELSFNVQHDIGIAATTDDITASLLYGGVAFGSVVIPGLDIKTGEQNYNLTVDGSLTLTDIDAFNLMAEGLVEDSEISLEASATVKAHTLGLTYGGLDLERTLPLKGFNQFSDPAPEIDYIDWFGCSNDVYQMDINVTLTNPSNMGLDGIGALNLSLYYADSYLGYAESLKPELGLPRGESVQLFRATVPQDSTALSSMALGVVGGSAQFYITGDNPYSTEYTQFQEAISKVNMSILYTDGLSSLGFNTSCDILSLLA